jgi:hypothetical protein
MIIVLAASTAAFVGCSSKVASKSASSREVVMTGKDTGPPDHAPAHGYHKKQQGNADVVLVYDNKIDVYVVSGYDDCYYTAGQFYRRVQGAWEWSVCIEGPWKAIAHRNDLPPGLRKHKA